MSNNSRRKDVPHRQTRAQARRRDAASTPDDSNETQKRKGFRPALERQSAPWLLMLHRLPRFVIPVLLAALLFGGLVLSDQWAWLGAIMLGIITLFIAWLSALAWPVLKPGSRLARGLLVVALAGVTVLKALGRM